MASFRKGFADPSLDTILFLSDHPDAVSLWESLFARKSCLLFYQPSPRAALEFLDGFMPSLLIIDLDLPQDDLLLVSRQMRAAYSGPVLILLADTNSQEIMDLYQAGVDECLINPGDAVFLPVKAVAWMRRYRWLQPSPLHLNNLT